MNNLLLHPAFSTIDEKWDLKGRIPKPGLLSRSSSAARRQESDTHLQAKKAALRTRSTDPRRCSRIMICWGGAFKPLFLFRDALSHGLAGRRFYLTEEAREGLLKTLQDDVEFLKTHNCMDYRLGLPGGLPNRVHGYKPDSTPRWTVCWWVCIFLRMTKWLQGRRQRSRMSRKKRKARRVRCRFTCLGWYRSGA